MKKLTRKFTIETYNEDTGETRTIKYNLCISCRGHLHEQHDNGELKIIDIAPPRKDRTCYGCDIDRSFAKPTILPRTPRPCPECTGEGEVMTGIGLLQCNHCSGLGQLTPR